MQNAKLIDERPSRDAHPARGRPAPTADVDTRTLQYIRSQVAAASGEGDDAEGPDSAPGPRHAR